MGYTFYGIQQKIKAGSTNILHSIAQTELLETRPIALRERLHAHLAILRLDHSVKQIFIVPGIVIAFTLTGVHSSPALGLRVLLAILAATAVASSNYVLNELLDAPYDRLHPTKRNRPAARGSVSYPVAYAQWLLLAGIGFSLALIVSRPLFFSVGALWLMGCAYNIPPLRTKEVRYLDVLSESINNPLRLSIGWYAIASLAMPPLTLLISYWMLGCYFMALKRFSEYRQIGRESACLYRHSFVFYTEKSLLNSVSFYAAAAMLFFGAYATEYHLELVLAFPVIAILMAVYYDLAFKVDSAVQNPEKLIWEPLLVILVAACMVLLTVLSLIRLDWLRTALSARPY